MMEWLSVGLTAAAVLLLIVLIILVLQANTLNQLRRSRNELKEELQQMSRDLQELAITCAAITENQRGSMENIVLLLQNLREDQRGNAELQAANLSGLMQHQQTAVNMQLSQLEQRMNHLQHTTDSGLDAIRSTLEQHINDLRGENHRQLEEIRTMVDEKLQTTLEKRIADSFRLVSEQLENVYKGLGDMQSLAGDVGSLKKVLTGVKTRGILGQVQLDAILKEMLAPEQYVTNAVTVPGSTNRVEFAVKLPNTDDSFIYLPIDSKFPGDTYSALLDAQESGDRTATEKAWKKLEQTLISEAQDIREKYLQVPYTTAFGIMFLPFEGLYAEVVRHNLLERLQRDYHINVAGPSTMAALLNSLQMGFKTLAIQKRSGEVWQVLGAVKNEFSRFRDALLGMQKHLNLTSRDLDELLGTRTNTILRSLKNVQQAELSQLPPPADATMEDD